MAARLDVPATCRDSRAKFVLGHRWRLQLLERTTGIQPVVSGGHLFFQPSTLLALPRTSENTPGEQRHQINACGHSRATVAVQEPLPPLTTPRSQQRPQREGTARRDGGSVVQATNFSPRSDPRHYTQQRQQLNQLRAEEEQLVVARLPRFNAAKLKRHASSPRMETLTRSQNGVMESNSGRCCVCMEKQSTVLFLPCRHLCTCSSCARLLQRRRCPYCNGPYKKTTHVFIP
uniref:Uncharacterized protein TCIL3000_8_3530 n=1 Tax=Trypanosoma congolense (strain IL3000) TaxID=1068625 RepID=G0URX2_TRYCI|nr:unnamed protein product [Trypanosoma congolense IL3000]